MADPSPHYQILSSEKSELMSPSYPPIPDMNAFSQMSLSSPSYPQPFYNWGMYPYMYNPGYQAYLQPLPCTQNQMVPSDPSPSYNSINNENISPDSLLESSSLSPIVPKRRRSDKENAKTRVVFTFEQKCALNTLFLHMNNLMKQERDELGEAIGLNQSQIKIWLQNRRYKDKKRLPEVADRMKSKLDYDEERARKAVRIAIDEFKKCTAQSMNMNAHLFHY